MNEFGYRNRRRCSAGFKRVWMIWLVLAGLIWISAGESAWAYRSKSRTPRFYLKFKGMGTLATGGDYGNFVDLSEAYLTELNGSPGYTITVDNPSFFQGFGGEFGFETGRFAVGFSGGYIEKTYSVDYSGIGPVAGSEESYVADYKMSAIPLFLFVHYKLIDTRFLSAFLTLGEGVYLTTYKQDVATTYRNYELTYKNSYLESKRNTLGFHFGATFDFKITRNIALFVEAGYRIVKLEELEATAFSEDSKNTAGELVEGDLHYWVSEGGVINQLDIGEADFSGFEVEDLPAQFDFNGFSLSVGLKIIFGGGKKKGPVKIAPVD